MHIMGFYSMVIGGSIRYYRLGTRWWVVALLNRLESHDGIHICGCIKVNVFFTLQLVQKDAVGSVSTLGAPGFSIISLTSFKE